MPPPDGVDLVPVDHDPFNSPDQAAMQPESYANPLVQKFLGGVVGGLATLPQRAIQNSQWSVDTGNYDPGPTLEAATLPMGTGAIAGVPVKGAEAVLGAGPIRAYHSSPHDFDAFDLSKIGTGEGAQAYGHGLYFAESPAVSGQGGQYYNAFANKIIQNGDVEGIATHALKASKGDRAKAIDFLENGQWQTNAPKQWDDAISLLKSDKIVGPRTYEVNINADPEHFLDWDKPLSQQSQAVKDTLGLRMTQQLGPSGYLMKSDKLGGWHNPDNTGGALYQSGDKVAAAQRFSDAGIPGIKYLDQGSRPARSLADTQDSIKYYSDILNKEPNNQFAADQLKQYQNDLDKYDKGTRNYVVFNDKIVDILRKYGLAGLSTLPPALQAAAHQQLTPVDHDPFVNHGS